LLREIKTPEWVTPIGIRMKNKTSRISDEVVKEIFPKRLNRHQESEKVIFPTEANDSF